jgi:hypothetical protein
VLDGKTGFVTELTAESLAKSITSLINNEVVRKNFGAAANVHTHANYGVERLVKDHSLLYKEITSNLKP